MRVGEGRIGGRVEGEERHEKLEVGSSRIMRKRGGKGLGLVE